MTKMKGSVAVLMLSIICAAIPSLEAQQKVVAPKKTAYRFATWNPPELQVYNQLSIKAFQRDFPGVRIDTEVTPFAQYPQKLLLDIASGTAADVFQVSFGWTGSFVKQKVLLDLKPLLASMTIPRGVAVPSEFSQATIEAMTYDGELVGVPYETYAPAIIYNKTMFAKAGIPFPTSSWTWDDLKAAAKKLTIPNQQWGIYPYVLINYHATFIEGNGGSYVGPDGRAVGNLNGPKVLEAVRFLLDLYQQGYAVNPGIITSMGGSAIPLLLTGKLGMVLNSGVWILDTAKTQGTDVENTLGLVAPPRPSRITLGIHALCVGRSAQDKETSALLALYLGAAQEVIDKSLTSYRAIPILTAQKSQIALLPAIKPQYDSWLESRGKAFTMDTSVDGVTLAEVYQTAFESVLAGKATVENAFLKAAQDYDQRVFGRK